MISRQAERKQDTSQLLVSLHEILKDSLEQAGQVWDNFETDLAFINSLPGDEFRAQLKNHWRYQWIKTALAVSYGLDFHLV
jgi:hypothetical protein